MRSRGYKVAPKLRLQPQDWAEEALCNQVDPELFYPEPEGSKLAVRQAKRLCASCPAQRACVEYALRNREEFGVWGGTTEQERRRLFRQADRSNLDKAA